MAMPLRAIDQPALPAWPKIPNPGEKCGLMKKFTRITFDPQVMGGKACIRGMRVTAGMIVGLIASGRTIEEVLLDYPYLEREDVMEASSCILAESVF